MTMKHIVAASSKQSGFRRSIAVVVEARRRSIATDVATSSRPSKHPTGVRSMSSCRRRGRRSTPQSINAVVEAHDGCSKHVIVPTPRPSQHHPRTRDAITASSRPSKHIKGVRSMSSSQHYGRRSTPQSINAVVEAHDGCSKHVIVPTSRPSQHHRRTRDAITASSRPSKHIKGVRSMSSSQRRGRRNIIEATEMPS